MIQRDTDTRMFKERLAKLSQRRFKEVMSDADFQAQLQAVLETRVTALDGEDGDQSTAALVGSAAGPAAAVSRRRWWAVGLTAVVLLSLALWWTAAAG